MPLRERNPGATIELHSAIRDAIRNTAKDNNHLLVLEGLDFAMASSLHQCRLASWTSEADVQGWAQTADAVNVPLINGGYGLTDTSWLTDELGWFKANGVDG